MNKTDSTKEKILESSWEEFVDRGYSGARMQRIADQAGVNKAMIYYYFNSKDNLFENLIKSVFEKFFSSIFDNFEYGEKDFETILKQFVDRHIDFLQNNPQIPRVIIRELHSNNPITGKVLRKLFAKLISQVIGKIDNVFKSCIEKGQIRQVDTMQVMWNIAGMNLFFFFLKPVLEILLKEYGLKEDDVLAMRKEVIVDMVLYGLVPREN